MKYLPRLVDKEIDELMEIMGAVLIEGPKWCGKSTTGIHHAKSVIEFQNPDRKQEYDEIKKTKPSLFLNGEKPRMFDEWQMYPVVWDCIRTDVDHTGLKGQYILTGSAKPSEGETMHTGTGRISRVLMRPMSLFESKESTGEVSLKDIFEGKDISGVSKLSLEDLASVIVRGGWPASIGIKSDAKYKVSKEYVKALLHEEVRKINGVERNPEKMQNVLRSLARNISTQVSNTTIEGDIKNNFDDDISRPTLNDYLNTLEKLFVIEDVKATNLNFRSKYAIRTKPKKYFVDPSIATAILDIKPKDLINDLNTFGFLFEAMVERDLKIYANSFNAKCYHYQDYQNKEIDSVIELEDGEWCAFEIKLGANKIGEGAKNLLKIKEELEKEKGKVPSVLCVICGMSNAAYQRPDGVYVVPITALKP